MNPIPDRSGAAACLSFLFSGVTSAMQPARAPIALLAVMLIVALAPIVDAVDGQAFGPRGFSSGPMTATEVQLNHQRARNAAARIAQSEVDALESAARESDGADAVVSRRALASAVRAATEARIADGVARGVAPDDPEFARLRQRAAEAMLAIEETAPRGVATAFLAAEANAIRQATAAILSLNPPALLGAVEAVVLGIPSDAISASPIWFPLGLLATMSLVMLLAGASCRMAAVHAGRNARLTALEGAVFARSRALRLLSIPVLPVIVIGVLALIVLTFALLLRVPVLGLVSGALFIVPLLVGLLAAVLAISVVASLPLMPAAVAVEDCDSGDAITRAGALVLSRPLAWIGMLVGAMLALVVGTLLVSFAVGVAGLGVNALLASVGGPLGQALASGDASDISALYGPDRLIATLAGFWIGLLRALIAAYAFSLCCDLATRGYLWMRERVDGENIGTVAGYGLG
jgi:hypothetical protein